MRFLLLLPLLFGFAGQAFAADGPIQVTDAKARPTAPGGNGVVYMVVANGGPADDSLTGLTTPIADRAEVHKTVTENGVMRMDPVTDVPVKASSSVTFGPAGLHVMLTGLKQPLKLGDSFPLTLDFQKAGPVTVTVSVEKIRVDPKPMADMPGMKM